MKRKSEIEWSSANWKETIQFHWCKIGSILDGDELIPKFRMFCRKTDIKCFVEDLDTGDLIEFNGAQAQGMRMCKSILDKRKKNENVSDDTALE